jgi:hypothetical protein
MGEKWLHSVGMGGPSRTAQPGRRDERQESRGEALDPGVSGSESPSPLPQDPANPKGPRAAEGREVNSRQFRGGRAQPEPSLRNA